MKKYLLGLFAVLFIIGMSAFTKQQQKSKPSTIERWHFTQGKTLGDAKSAMAYDTNVNSANCDDTQVLPCIVEFDNSIYPTLQDYLDQFSTEQQVVDAAAETRSN